MKEQKMHTNEWGVGFLESKGVIWRHKITSLVHAQLTSGNHSDLFCNISRLLEEPKSLEIVCESLLNEMQEPCPEKIRFIGSAIGGIQIAHVFGSLSEQKIAFTEKVDGEMKFVRFALEPGEVVVVVEDVLTTGGTTLKTIAACKKAGATVFPTVLAVVNRSKTTEILAPDGFTYTIKSFAEIGGEEWLPDECPLCSKGSTAKKPKAHWNEFFPT